MPSSVAHSIWVMLAICGRMPMMRWFLLAWAIRAGSPKRARRFCGECRVFIWLPTSLVLAGRRWGGGWR